MTQKKENKKFGAVSQGLKYKLKISFCLASLVPFLVCVYLVSNYIVPQVGLKADIALALIISVCIIALGFHLVKSVFSRIISVHEEARLIAAGDFTRIVDAEPKDEVGNLAQVLNELAQRISVNMDEFKNLSQKTEQLNVSIQKRLIVLSGLLQISSTISQDAELDEILGLTVGKAKILAFSDTSFLLSRDEQERRFRMEVTQGIGAQNLSTLAIGAGSAAYEALLNASGPFMRDREYALPQSLSEVFDAGCKFLNVLMLPVVLQGRVVRVLGIASNQKDFAYSKEDIELLDVFAKQIAIAVRHSTMKNRLKKLEIKDTLTGLYNDLFIRNRLKEEIQRAIMQRRSCALILLNVDNFRVFQNTFGSLQAEGALRSIAQLILESISAIDRAARVADNEFAIVLPEKSKRQAQEIAENIRKKVQAVFAQESDISRRLTMSGGVSENPLDGVDAEQLLAKSKELLLRAKQQGKNRIEILPGEALNAH